MGIITTKPPIHHQNQFVQNPFPGYQKPQPKPSPVDNDVDKVWISFRQYLVCLGVTKAYHSKSIGINATFHYCDTILNMLHFVTLVVVTSPPIL